MDTRSQTNILLLFACLGVVIFHVAARNPIYIGNELSIGLLSQTYKEYGLGYTIQKCLEGMTAIIGIFLINSGYGLAISKKSISVSKFYKQRFLKIWVYSFLCGLFCTGLMLLNGKGLHISYLYSLIPIFGFHEMPRDWSVVQYWYLSLAFTYYIIFPFIVSRLDKLRFILISIFCVCFGYLIYFNIYSYVSIYHSAICRFPEFLFGILLARDERLKSIFFETKNSKILLGILLLLISYSTFYIGVLNPLSNLFFSISCYFLGIQLAAKFAKFDSLNRYLGVLKCGTFSLYLTHNVLVNVIMAIPRKFTSMESLANAIEQSYYVRVLFAVCLSTVFLFLFGYIEKMYLKNLKI